MHVLMSHDKQTKPLALHIGAGADKDGDGQCCVQFASCHCKKRATVIAADLATSTRLTV